MNYMSVIAVVVICLLKANPATAEPYSHNGFSFEIAPPPSWINTTSANLTLPYGHDTDYLLVDDQVRVVERSQIHYFKMSLRANNVEALQYVSRVEAYFNPEYQSLTWHSIDIIRDGKTVSKLDPSEIRMVQKEDELDQEMLTGGVTSLIFVPNTRVQDVIEFSYSIEGVNPIFDGLFYKRLSLNWGDSVARRYARVVVPNNRKIVVKAPSTQIIQKSESATGKDYVIDNISTTAVKYEDGLPINHDPKEYVEFSEYQSWADVSAWAERHYQNTAVTDPELVSLIDRLRSLPPEGAAQNALQFVQDDIRYVGIELGVNSHAPRSPDEVMKNGFGDCKDKSLLLVSILKAIGIKAYPALVSTTQNDAFLQLLPSPRHFDHVITLIELDGRSVWVDPTKQFQQGKLHTQGYRDYGYAMPIGHPEKKPLKMEFDSRQIPTYSVTETFRILAYGGPTLLEISNEFSASKADSIRRDVATKGLDKLEKQFLEYTKEIHPDASVYLPIQVDESADKDLISIREYYLLPTFTKQLSEGGRWGYSTKMFAFFGYLQQPDVAGRVAPWRLPAPIRLKHRIQLYHPVPLNMEHEAEDTNISHPAFTFHSKERFVDNLIVRDVDLEFSALRQLEPSELQLYSDMIDKVNDHGYVSYNFENGTEDSIVKAMQDITGAIQPFLVGGESK